jgi:hypothetical protein
VVDAKQLESVTQELIELYSITAPPIPIERMLQHPLDDMWDDVDVSDLTGNFLNISTPFSPRMSLARFLARHIARSNWGTKRGLGGLNADDESIHRFARVIVMPKNLLTEISAESRTPELISLHFEVPEDDARLRLLELGVQPR